MTRAVGKGMLKGVASHLIPEGITHIQYVNDTILMVDGEDNSILHMKFVLYYFEWLSGLKINYHKNEAYTFGMDEEESMRIANRLNCQLGELPMKYLGIPLDNAKLGMAIPLDNAKLGMSAFVGMVDKVAKRVPPWKGKIMSSGGRLILSNSCLASLPTYMMGFYLAFPPIWWVSICYLKGLIGIWIPSEPNFSGEG
jgi:hypothetical protein